MSQHHQNKPAPAPDELEAPEVVAVLYKSGDVLTAEECGIALEVCAKVETPLMTVAQHNRIVASLTRPAQTEQQPVAAPKCATCNGFGKELSVYEGGIPCRSCKSDPTPAQDGRDLPDHLNDAIDNLVHDNYERSQAGSRNRQADADLIRAALAARPAQTEQQPAYVECRECTDCGHVGINDAHQTDATCAMCDWSGPSPVEDQCPDCGKENVMGAACPKCSGRYRILAETHVAAPIAQTVQQPEQSGLVEALEAIVRQYPNSDISHVDYRVHACRQAEQALDAYRAALPNHRGGA
jgi:DnaJ-class molecular chaperone